jgi:alanyl-tRNA synthetase
MDQDMMQKLVLESVAEHNGRKTLSCARAFEIYRRHGIALADIGRICNENDVRIRSCQLGCFP